MNQEIKMIDVLPVLYDEMICVRADRKNVVLDFKRATGLPVFEDGVTAICYAINNHDRLFEENKRLRESLKAASSSITRMLSADEHNGDMKEFTNARNQAFCSVRLIDDLLSELDCQSKTGGASQEFKPLDFFEIGRLEK